MSTATVTKTVSLDADVAEWLEEQAKKENRKVSNFVETKLKELRDQSTPQKKGGRK